MTFSCSADYLAHRKFGKQIQRRQLDLPEYAASFVNYKALKKVSVRGETVVLEFMQLRFSRQLIKQLSATPTIPAQSSAGIAQDVPEAQAALRANKEVFFFRLVWIH
jgi:CDK inhibitor PHO81